VISRGNIEVKLEGPIEVDGSCWGFGRVISDHLLNFSIFSCICVYEYKYIGMCEVQIGPNPGPWMK